jgi:hypothetical protein
MIRPLIPDPPAIHRALCAWLFVASVAAAPALAEPIDLRTALESTNGEAANRRLSITEEGNRVVAHLDARGGDGGALVKNLQFRTGVIEVDIQGRNAPGQSFVGIGFNAHDPAGDYEAIYFRPFNFGAADPVRRAHSVQYIAMPGYGWQVLRETRAGQFEAAVVPEPRPDDWFHARVEVDEKQVRVFVNRASTPTLTVERLAPATAGRVGLWVGNGSEGKFANLEITPGR